MVNSKKLSDDLNKLTEGSIILLETSSDQSFETSMASVEALLNKNDSGIIISANRPYSNLMSVYKKNNIDTNKLYVLDLISKSQNADVEADNVMYVENASALTNISLAVNEILKNLFLLIRLLQCLSIMNLMFLQDSYTVF